MKKRFPFFVFLCFNLSVVYAQQFLSLDDCRQLALENNKQLKISDENIAKAETDKKAAFTQYLPDLSFTGGYLYNQKNVSLLGENKFLPVGNLTAGGEFIPTGEYAVIPQNAFDMDIQHVFVGNFSLTQPVFMGGKIAAYNKITDYSKALAERMKEASEQEVLLQVEEAYWQVISLSGKKELSDSYVDLLKQMDSDMQNLIEEGISTQADGLSVKVKLNEAEMTQLQVENGLQLSKMLLCQICGLPINESIILADEQKENLPTYLININKDVNSVLVNRPELQSLDLATKIYEKKETIVRSEMLPSVALVGNYTLMNPNSFNGFETQFSGMWNVGVMVNIPLFHFGEHTYKVRSAKTETRIKKLELEDAKEKIELQVNQTKFKVTEAEKKLVATSKNKESADENLRYANLGFKEGVIPASNLMEAQTAWFKAHSEYMDAQIGLRLSQVQLAKAMGELASNHK